MAYDYTREFLVLHKDTVHKLRNLAMTGDIWRLEFDNPKSMVYTQRQINNVLANMAVNLGQEGQDLRQTIRTWTMIDPQTGAWILHVGKPPMVLPGRKKGRPIGSLAQNLENLGYEPRRSGLPGPMMQALAMDVATTPQAPVERRGSGPVAIVSQEDYIKLLIFLEEQGPGSRIHVAFPDKVDLPTLSAQLPRGWSAELVSNAPQEAILTMDKEPKDNG